MKVLCVVFTAFVAVNAGPGATSDLKKIAERVLATTKSLQSELNLTLSIINKVPKTLQDAIEKIPSIVAKDHEVAELKKSIGKSDKCQKVFDSKVLALHKTLEDHVTEITNIYITILKSTLGKITEQLQLTETALTKDLNAEIEACEADESKCNITGYFTNLLDDVFAIVGTSEQTVTHSVTSAASKVQNQLIREKFEDMLLEPVVDCLKSEETFTL